MNSIEDFFFLTIECILEKKSKSHKAKRWLRYLGIVFMLAAVYYIVRTLLRIEIDFSMIQLTRERVLVLSFAFFACILVVYLFGVVWLSVLQALSVERLQPFVLLQVYVKTNIGKYLPGNLMHFVARNIVVHKQGLSHQKIAFSSFLEMIFVLIILFIYFILLKRQELLLLLQEIPLFKTSFLIVIPLVLLLLLFFAYRKRKYLKEKLQRISFPRLTLAFLSSVLVYTLAFSLLGLGMAYLIASFGNIELLVSDYLHIFLMYALAWLAGVIVIGAPGGIGIRESFLLIFLSPLYGEDIVLVSSLLHRFVFILAEIAAFGLSWLGYKKQRLANLENKKPSA